VDPVSRRIALVAYERFQLLDLAGPADVFRAASLLSGGPAYEVVILTPGGEPVRSDSGVAVEAHRALPSGPVNLGEPFDTLLVVGGLGIDAAVADPSFVVAVRALAAGARRIGSVCTGAFGLAAAGLLDGHRATTHWASCAALAERFPQVEVEPDRIYVEDRDRWTSAGVTAGIDLALALVEADLGGEIAHAVAGWLVVFVQRTGGQAQFSAQLLARPARTDAIRAIQRWLPDHLDQDLSVGALAARAAMSERGFARRFRAETGSTPAAHVEALRVEAARTLLETTDLVVAEVARAVGLGRPETLHRAFARQVGTTPDRYRRHFARRAS